MENLKVTGKQKIGNLEFVSIEGGFGEGKKAMTVKDIAEIHKKEVKHVNELINRNRKRFVDGKDVIDLKEVVEDDHNLEEYGFTKMQIAKSPNLYLLSERGYSKLLKILEDDTAWEIYDQLVDDYFINRKKIQSLKSNISDLDIKRMNAEARLKNANTRLAKTFVELSKDATTEVNKALLQNKAVEVLTGEKLLEMPTLREKLFDCDQIAKKLSVLSKSGKPHGTAVSQIIQQNIQLEEHESEIVPEAVNGWSGSVVKYSESVIEKVEAWLEDNNYPSIIKGTSKNYHVFHKDIA